MFDYKRFRMIPKRKVLTDEKKGKKKDKDVYELGNNVEMHHESSLKKVLRKGVNQL